MLDEKMQFILGYTDQNIRCFLNVIHQDMDRVTHHYLLNLDRAELRTERYSQTGKVGKVMPYSRQLSLSRLNAM